MAFRSIIRRVLAPFPGLRNWLYLIRQPRYVYGIDIRQRLARKVLRPDSSHRFLEVGSVSWLSAKLSAKVKWYGNLDIEQVASQLYLPKQVGRGIVTGDLCNLPLVAESIDRLSCIAVLEHIAEDVSAAKELYRVLAPSGIVAVYVPLEADHRAVWEAGDYPDHVRPGYSPKALVSLLNQGGFSDVQTTICWGTWTTAASRLWRRLIEPTPLRYIPPSMLTWLGWFSSLDDPAGSGGGVHGLFAIARK